MRLLPSLVVFATLLLPAVTQSTKCIACGLLLTLLQQLENPSQPPSGQNPDITCQELGFCDGTCALFPNNTWPVVSPVITTDGGVIDQRRRRLRAHLGQNSATSSQSVKFSADHAYNFLHEFERREATRGTPMDFYETMTTLTRFLALGPCEDALNITCDISRVFDQHLPLIDNDYDNFAGPTSFLSNGFRGGDWRGRDCNDSDPTVYPGRIGSWTNVNVDNNCNGIYGSNANGAYEQQFCSGANAPMGVAILGDSAAAHFHIPPQYLNARSFNLSGILEMASNEADWPQCSWTTGYRDTAECPYSYNVTMGSIYQRMNQLNLCNHRDFQNIGVNGARVGSMASNIIASFQRNQQSDAPVLVFFALIGNDVCNGHPGSGSMTTPDEFKASVLESLAYLDTILPKGSHVAFLGLVDGRVLYDTTHNRTHPIGVSYPAVYDYLSCNNANPCWGWLNSNETWRNFTSERAANLTAVYDEIIVEYASNYTHFDMYRVPVDWMALVNSYAKIADPMNIIEPVDGFHPSQTGHQLLAAMVWTELLLARPNWLPSANPYNPQIQTLFGDQGGY